MRSPRECRVPRRTLSEGSRQGWKRGLLSLFAVSALLLPAGHAHADQVDLANGDRLTGTVKTLDGGKITIETPYAKSVEVDWASVKAVRIDTPTDIVLEDGTHLKGTVETTSSGALQVNTPSAGAVVIEDPAKIAKINVPEKPAVTYEGDFQAASSYLTGNTDTLSANLSGYFVARSKRQRLTLRGRWNYGEEDGNVTAREASGSIKYDFFPTEKFYVYANTLLLYNAFQDLDLRSTVGAGAGYQFWEDAVKKLSAELGISYVNEDRRVADDDSYASGRWSINFDYILIPDKIRFFHFQEGYFGLEQLDDVYLHTEQGLRFNLVKDFYTSFQVNVDWDNTPSPGFDKTDTAILFGLGYSFSL